MIRFTIVDHYIDEYRLETMAAALKKIGYGVDGWVWGRSDKWHKDWSLEDKLGKFDIVIIPYIPETEDIYFIMGALFGLTYSKILMEIIK